MHRLIINHLLQVILFSTWFLLLSSSPPHIDLVLAAQLHESSTLDLDTLNENLSLLSLGQESHLEHSHDNSGQNKTTTSHYHTNLPPAHLRLNSQNIYSPLPDRLPQVVNTRLYKQHRLARASDDDIQYAVVVDCGSSGSRVQIFYWPSSALDQQNFIGEEQDFLLDVLPQKLDTLRNASTRQPLSLRIRPGLASVRDNPAVASDYLAPIMRFASEHVPPSEQPRTPVYVLGTAGMRVLSAAQQAAILEDITRDVGREYNFQEPIRAEVISGTHEGLYQWLSVNALGHRLGAGYDQTGTNLAPPATYSARSKRLGLIEMGGYSAQIAFEVSARLDAEIWRRLKHAPAAWQAYSANRLELNLTQHSRKPSSRRSLGRIFSVSFLGFGSDIVRSWAIDLLVRDSLAYLHHYGLVSALLNTNARNDSSTTQRQQLWLDDPCLPANSQEVVLKPTSVLDARSHTLGHSITSLADEQFAFQVRLRGRGNFHACLVLLKRLIMISKFEKTICDNAGQSTSPAGNRQTCDSAALIGTHFIPWHALQFVGLGELYYTSHEMLRASGRFSGALVQFEAANLCAKPLELISAQYPADDDEFKQRRNLLACFKASWLLAWLTTALRMPMAATAPYSYGGGGNVDAGGTVNFTTTSSVDGQEVDWKLGAVLAKTIASATAAAATPKVAARRAQ